MQEHEALNREDVSISPCFEPLSVGSVRGLPVSFSPGGSLDFGAEWRARAEVT